MAGRFFGRTEELGGLRSACARARRQRRVTAVVVEGHPGVGKSRLLAEALRHSPLSSQVAMAAYEPERGVPFALGQELVRTLAASSARARECLAPFLAPSPGGGVLGGAGLFEATHRTLSLSEPLLLAVDDLQWADERSTALLHYLVRGAEAEGEGLAVILAGRSSRALRTMVVGLERLLGDRLVRIPVGPLDHEAAVALAHAVNPSLDRPTAESVAARSQGSPFWCELLAGAGGTDADVVRVVAGRLAALGVDAVAALAAVTVLARPVQPGELAGILGWSEARLREAVGELADNGLVAPEGAGVRVAHDLVRAAVERRIPPADLRSAHRLVAAWLADEAGNDVTQLLTACAHRRAAGLDHQALTGRILRSPLRRSVGLSGLRTLAGLVDELSPEAPQEVELQRQLAVLADELGQHRLALQRWPRVAERLTERAETVRAWLAAADAAQQLQRTAEARAHLQRARRTADDDPVLSIELDAADATILRWSEHQLDASRRLTTAALERARGIAAAGDTPTWPGARFWHAYMRALVLACVDAMQRNAPEEILPLADEITQVAGRLDLHASVQGSLRKGSALMLLGRLTEAEERLESAYAAARRSYLADLALDTGAWLLWTRQLMGRLAEAEDVALECDALAARVGEHSRQATIVGLRRHILSISRGDRSAALAALQTLAAEEGDRHHRIEVHLAIATWLARLEGRAGAEQVRAALTAGRADADAAGCARCRTEFLFGGVDALARTGAVEGAARWLADAEQARGTGALQDWLQIRARGSLAVARDSSAAATLEEVVTAADRLGMGLEAIWARLDLGRLPAVASDGRAVTALQQARALAEEAGAVTEQRLAEQALRQLGVRTWRRGSPDRSSDALVGLSRREREIAALVAGGASNLDIAQALFLSRKTVERHVSAMFLKLQVKNRAQLAARVATADHRDEQPTDVRR